MHTQPIKEEQLRSLALVQYDQLSTISHLSDILDAIPAVIMLVNLDRKVVLVNERMISGFFPDEKDRSKFIGLTPGETFNCLHLYNDDNHIAGKCGMTQFCPYCGAAKALGNGFRGCPGHEECHLMRKGKYEIESLDLAIWTHPITILDMSLVVLAAIDISKEKRERVLERIFFHDILNSIGAVEGLCSLMANGIMEPTTRELNNIRDNLQHAIDEINSQRQLCDAESGDLVLNIRTVTSEDVLKDMTLRFKNSQVAENRVLVFSSDTVSVSFKTDPVILRRSLTNLIKNGFEAIESGEAVKVGCSVSESQDVTFWVQTPKVMPEAIQMQVFNRSFSTKGTGRGLGLYSVRLLVERYLKGSVKFLSSETQGTLFAINLPIDQEED